MNKYKNVVHFKDGHIENIVEIDDYNVDEHFIIFRTESQKYVYMKSPHWFDSSWGSFKYEKPKFYRCVQKTDECGKPYSELYITDIIDYIEIYEDSIVT